MKTRLNLDLLLQECKALKYNVDGSGVLMAYYANEPIKNDMPTNLFAAICEIRDAIGANPLGIMVNIVPPGIVVPKHRDFLNPVNGINYPCVHRFHLPIRTNMDATWWDETKEPGRRIYMNTGYWCGPVPYWKIHDVQNLGKVERIHLVVDLDKFVEGAKYDDR